LQPQSAGDTGALIDGVDFGFVTCTVVFDVTTSTFGIHRENAVRSATSTMYQHFLVASQRAPSALTASFSAKGVTRLILMLEIIVAHSGGGLGSKASLAH